MNGRLLVVDFDGVLCDSAVECMLTAYNAYKVVLGSSGAPVRSIDALNAAHAELFLRHRHLVRVAKEYFLLWYEIERDADLERLAELKADKSIAPDLLTSYHDHFYSERVVWRNADPNGWNAANPLFPGIDPLALRIRDGSAVILSAKDEPSIRSILAFHGVDPTKTDIYGSDTGLDKHELVQRIADEHEIAAADMLCLDDNLDNLTMLADEGVKGCLAMWGYNSPREQKMASQRGIQLLELKQLPGWMHDHA